MVKPRQRGSGGATTTNHSTTTNHLGGESGSHDTRRTRGRDGSPCASQRLFQTAHGEMYTNVQTHGRKADTIVPALTTSAGSDRYVVDHRPSHRRDRDRHRLTIASSGRREPSEPRLDERAVARRVPRFPENIDDGKAPAGGRNRDRRAERHRPRAARRRRRQFAGATTCGHQTRRRLRLQNADDSWRT